MKIEKLNNSKDFVQVLIVGALITFAIISRMMPHPANFAPIAAVAIFGGAILPRKLALTLPLLVMVISDLVIGLHPLIIFTWGSFIAIALLSSVYLKKITPKAIVGGSIVASILFYLVTNFGVWIEGRLYVRTFSGLMESYFNALPFFRNTLLGDLIYTGMLFGAYALVQHFVLSNRTSKRKAHIC
jgi:hypothetical protein